MHRCRPDLESLKQHLQGLGATGVLTYEELEDSKAADELVASITGFKGKVRPRQISGKTCVTNAGCL